MGKVIGKKYIGKLDEHLAKNKINPFYLTEFDQWVNDLTREDINDIIEKYEVFGVDTFDYKIIEKDELRNAPNFSVNLIFLEEDRDKVVELIEKYRRGEIDIGEIAKKLVDMAFYVCEWV